MGDPTDPVELLLQKTGCLEAHYKVQECIAETGDWRQCQHIVKAFKECMMKHEQAKRLGTGST